MRYTNIAFLCFNLLSLFSQCVLTEDLQCYVCVDCENDYADKIQTCVDYNIDTTTVGEPTDVTTEYPISTTDYTDIETTDSPGITEPSEIKTTIEPESSTLENQSTTQASTTPIEEGANTSPIDNTDRTTVSEESNNHPPDNNEEPNKETTTTAYTDSNNQPTTSGTVDITTTAPIQNIEESINLLPNSETTIKSSTNSAQPIEESTTLLPNSETTTTSFITTTQSIEEPTTLIPSGVKITQNIIIPTQQIEKPTTSLSNNPNATESSMSSTQSINDETTKTDEATTQSREESTTAMSNSDQTMKTTVDIETVSLSPNNKIGTTSVNDLTGPTEKLNLNDQPPNVQMVDDSENYGSRYAFIRAVREVKNNGQRRPRCVVTSYKEQNRTVVVRGCSFVQEDDPMQHCNGFLNEEVRGDITRCLVCDLNLCNSATKAIATFTLVMVSIITFL